MKLKLTLFALLGWATVYGQMYDAQWLLSFNTSVLDFRIDTVGLDTIAGNMPVVRTDADICDTSGNLLYFTNGVYIADKNGNILMNGDSLNPCEYTFQNYYDGLDIAQAALFLPKPGSLRYFYLIHFSNDADSNNRPGTLYYSLIDNEGNGGLGAVIEKNVPFFTGTILREGGMTACKHANGRDYWLIMGGDNSNEYFKFLFTPDGILGPFIQNIGTVYDEPYDWGYSKFSQDGSKYVTSCAEGLILIADFDRCSGEFSSRITLFNLGGYVNGQPVSSAIAEFSPNGRFVYATDADDLTQYDLWSDTIQDSIRVWNDSDSDFYQMDELQVAPNGKIYGSTYNGGLKALHVINYPDSLGTSCDFVYGGQPTLTFNSDALPNLINYRLGPLVGSGCDTIADIGQQKTDTKQIHIMPNPADKYAYVEMGMQGNYQFDLLSSLGQLIATKQTRQVDIFDTEGLASGVYLLRVTDGLSANTPITKKLVVQH